jgi:hypothetical protein
VATVHLSACRLIFVDEDPGYLANTGGPASRRRTERLHATVLGSDDGAASCRRVLRIGLDFGGADPLEVAQRLLAACGYADEAEARAAIDVPAEPCICRVDLTTPPARISRWRPRSTLRQLVMLGLCTAWRYDPSRPVLWTRASLTRRLELFAPAGFYA